MLSNQEYEMMKDIKRRLDEMHAHLSTEIPPLEDSASWFTYLAKLKEIQGNASNDVSFVGTLLAKEYLEKKYGVRNFDAADKSQNAPGIDIDVTLTNGKCLVAELKTTNPYKEKDFGTSQRKSIKKDFKKLSGAKADIKLFLVTDPGTFEFMKKNKYRSLVTGITIVLLPTGEEFTA